MHKQMIVRVPNELHQKVREIAKQNHWSYSDVMRAGLQKFIDDLGPKPAAFQLKKINLGIEPSEATQLECRFGSGPKVG